MRIMELSSGEPFVRTLRAQWLGQQLRSLREQRGLSLADLAASTGRSPTVWDRYERADWPIGQGDVAILLDVYEVDDQGVRERLLSVADQAWRLHRWDTGDQRDHDDTDAPFITVDWLRAQLLKGGTPEPQAVKAYSLLRAIPNTAVKEDEIIRQNPCRIKGYDRYHTPERPVANVAQVYKLADAMTARFRALILVAAFSGLRWGELAALRRSDVDLAAGTVRVPRKLAALRDRMEFGPPKSEASNRTVTLPAAAVAALKPHMLQHVAAGAEALVFTGGKGALLRTGNFGRAVKWKATVAAVGLPAGFHFHDLRHTGNNLAASTGASMRDLMHRMGHSSMRTALIYQHATSERDREIADAMDKRISKRDPEDPEDGVPARVG